MMQSLNPCPANFSQNLVDWGNLLPRYGQDVPPYQKRSFYAKAFKSYSPNGQKDTQTQYENITFPHTRAVIRIFTVSWLN